MNSIDHTFRIVLLWSCIKNCPVCANADTNIKIETKRIIRLKEK